jgi:hypothetical protein
MLFGFRHVGLPQKYFYNALLQNYVCLNPKYIEDLTEGMRTKIVRLYAKLNGAVMYNVRKMQFLHNRLCIFTSK